MCNCWFVRESLSKTTHEFLYSNTLFLKTPPGLQTRKTQWQKKIFRSCWELIKHCISILHTYIARFYPLIAYQSAWWMDVTKISFIVTFVITHIKGLSTYNNIIYQYHFGPVNYPFNRLSSFSSVSRARPDTLVFLILCSLFYYPRGWKNVLI